MMFPRNLCFLFQLTNYLLKILHSIGFVYYPGIAVDWISDNLYWSDEDLGIVVVSRIDGRYPHVLMNSIGRPRGIDVNPNTGYVFQQSASVTKQSSFSP